MDLDSGAALRIDSERVPRELRSLIPLVQRWGFESNREQDEFVSGMLRERPLEVQEFNRAVDAAQDQIRTWGAGLPKRHWSDLSPEDQESPYWSFLNVLKVRELTGYEEDDPEILKVRAGLAAEIARDRYNAASLKAEDAFRSKDFSTYVLLLEPFADLLSEVQKKKITLARRRSAG